MQGGRSIYMYLWGREGVNSDGYNYINYRV